MRILRYGSIGPAVELLQLALNRAGAGTPDTDGIFGSATDAALRRFQRENGITADGIAGNETHRALLPYYTGYRVYRAAAGDTVYALAERFGTTQAAIELSNPALVPERLSIGTALIIPLGFNVVPTDINWCSALAQYCVRGLAARYPFISVGDIGKSVMGRPLWRIGVGSGERRVLYNAAHHANEWICTPLLMKFCEELCAAYASDGSIGGANAAQLMAETTVNLVPLVNPDGLDLVTGELQSGEFYRAAQSIAADYPRYAFPDGWKANIRGTDLNLQYPALWDKAKEIKYSLGIVSPAPADYVGARPLIAPESRALYDYTLALSPELVIAWHTQGGVIYWRFEDYEPRDARSIGGKFAALSGYTLEDAPYASAYAGYKDWFIQSFDRPGYTVEAGKGVNPLPLSDFDGIYRENLGIMISGAT